MPPEGGPVRLANPEKSSFNQLSTPPFQKILDALHHKIFRSCCAGFPHHLNMRGSFRNSLIFASSGLPVQPHCGGSWGGVCFWTHTLASMAQGTADGPKLIPSSGCENLVWTQDCAGEFINYLQPCSPRCPACHHSRRQLWVCRPPNNFVLAGGVVVTDRSAATLSPPPTGSLASSCQPPPAPRPPPSRPLLTSSPSFHPLRGSRLKRLPSERVQRQ